MFSKAGNRIFGRWLEALGISSMVVGVTGSTINWYWLFAGVAIAAWGAYLIENNQKK